MQGDGGSLIDDCVGSPADFSFGKVILASYSIHLSQQAHQVIAIDRQRTCTCLSRAAQNSKVYR
jgi:hypothetical protein